MGMRHAKRDFPIGSELRLEALLKSIKDGSERRRIQSIHLWIKHGWSSEAIGETLGLHPVSVRKLWQRFRKEGEACFKSKPKGGRYRSYLKAEEERQCLEKCLRQAKGGHILVANHVRKTLEERIGHKIAVATVYRILHRTTWRKVAPRPKHPKANEEAMAAFKKTLPKASPKPKQ